MKIPRRLEPADRAPPEQAGIDRRNLVERDCAGQDLDGCLLPGPVIADPAEMLALLLRTPGLPDLVPFGVVHLHHPATTDRALFHRSIVIIDDMVDPTINLVKHFSFVHCDIVNQRSCLTANPDGQDNRHEMDHI